ncbi:hypothetical protein EW026_g3836 [Hermanssonia centrifuga]|uniref:20S-pre-rRNA D-site endonuclease NOB1 n=1 Tax=Hermanssonia centrifuga TaxID=98765 RepID=A0A4V3XAP4_9APHY|nr:hypothetical protein EW026_g3836 [Hermanssonia centrifuga]
MASTTNSKPACKNLVLDAGPLLSLSPLRGLAEAFYTVPQVLDELKDKRAREHFEKLGLSAGVRIQVQSPDSASLAHVIQFAKKTGDYSVLSTADLCVLALTYALEQREKAEQEKLSQQESQTSEPTEKDTAELSTQQTDAPDSDDAEEPPMSEDSDDDDNAEHEDEPYGEPLDVKLEQIEGGEAPLDESAEAQQPTTPPSDESPIPVTDEALYDDPSDEDDGEGEWITPSNVGLHKSRALHLIPDEDAKARRVGVEGKKIERVKTWVLRCHACFKICKDASRKFSHSSAPALQVHLKKNFQFKTRGTKYSIPAPKSGTAKTGPGEGLILREDQTAWLRAKKHADGKREREEKRIFSGTANAKGGAAGVVMGSWMDPDWVPEMLSVGTGGKGRSMRSGAMDGDMPTIGYGRKNPNERRRKK